jgi:hypothetical protein
LTQARRLGLQAASQLNVACSGRAGLWAVTWDPSHTTVTLRSFYWPGYFFYHGIGTSDYGGVYFGYGTKNTDIAFQL